MFLLKIAFFLTTWGMCISTYLSSHKQMMQPVGYPMLFKFQTSINLLTSLLCKETKFRLTSIHKTASALLKLFFQTWNPFFMEPIFREPKFSLKKCFSKTLLKKKKWFFSNIMNCLGSVRVTKDPSTLSGTNVIPFAKKQEATLLNFCYLPKCIQILI